MISTAQLTQQKRRELGIAARRMVVEHDDEKQSVEQVRNLYGRLLTM